MKLVNGLVIFLIGLNARSKSRKNSKQDCKYTKELKGHPKVTIDPPKNLWTDHEVGKPCYQNCENKCTSDSECEVFAINVREIDGHQLCRIFPKTSIDTGKVLWETSNSNRKWVS